MSESAPKIQEGDEEGNENVLSMAVETPEQAEQVIASMMPTLESVDDVFDLEIAHETLDFFIAERNRAATSGGAYAAAIFTVFNEAVKKLEAKLEKQNPKESAEMGIDLKVSEAYERIAKGELIHAIPLLHTALKDARFQDFWSERSEMRNAKRIELETLLDSTKQKWIALGRPMR